MFRLAKVNTTTCSPSKIIFNTPEEAYSVLPNKKNLNNGIKIQPDSTPMQRDYFNSIKVQLRKLHENGNTNKTIRFINRVPRIVTKN